MNSLGVKNCFQIVQRPDMTVNTMFTKKKKKKKKTPQWQGLRKKKKKKKKKTQWRTLRNFLHFFLCVLEQQKASFSARVEWNRPK
jgi:hypothetical protein